MKIEEITQFLSRYTYFDESKALLEFFSGLPGDLDLASAQYYIRSEFVDQSQGYDNSSFLEEYEEDYDPDYCEQCNDYHDYLEDDLEWPDEEDEHEETFYCCEDCG